jgi:hypothetical protein
MCLPTASIVASHHGKGASPFLVEGCKVETPRPRVRFAVDEAPDLMDVDHCTSSQESDASPLAVQVFGVMPRSEYTEEERSACWWTGEDFVSRKRMIRKGLQKIISHGIDLFTRALSDMQESVKSASRYDPDRCCENYMAVLLPSFTSWATTGERETLRGLEKHVCQISISSRKWRSYHRSVESQSIRDTVLRMQNAGVSEDEISAVYATHSRMTTIFARCLAVADERAVNDGYSYYDI